LGHVAYGLGTFEGLAAIRGLLEDWLGGYEQYAFEVEEVVDLGNGVAFAISRQSGRPAGSPDGTLMSQLWAYPFVWVEGMVKQVTTYADIDEARTVAERLAEERG
jgi:hypothetical protein